MKLKEKTGIGLAAFGVVALAAIITIASWGSNQPAPPPASQAKEKPQDVVKYMASEQFASLDKQKQQAYFDNLIKDSGSHRGLFRAGRDLSEEQQTRLRKTVRPLMRQHMRNRMKEYFKLSPEEKKDYLDDIIDTMQEARKRHEADRKKNGGSEPGKDGERRRRHRGPRSPEHMKKMIESTTPQERAQFMQFMLDMRTRMKERGMSRPGRR